jgi:hypothetical protein
LRGWTRFDDGKRTGRHIGKLSDGYKPPPREQLSDPDPLTWTEKDANGKPKDPWSLQWYLPLVNVETGDVVTFVTGSNGGDAAIKNLCRSYGRNLHRGRPIVALKVRGYKHKSFGLIKTPELPIIDWEPRPVAAPSNDGDGAFDPDVPFAI